MQRKKLKKSVWLPTLLALYFLAMAIYFGPKLINEGETTRLIVVSIIEIIIIIAVHIFYKRRERQKKIKG